MEFSRNDVVPNEDLNRRLNIENEVIVKGRKILEEVIKFLYERKAVSLVDEKSKNSKDLFKQLEVYSTHPEEAGRYG